MNRPVGRLFAIVDALQRRGRTTTAELAGELGVSERTAQRDLARLQELGITLDTTPGRSGGVSLAPGSVLLPLRFTDDELLALGLGVRLAARAVDGTLEQAAVRAFRRLEQVLTEETRTKLEALGQALALEPPGEPTGRVESLTVLELARAVHQTRTLVVRYAAPGNKESTRRVDPYGLARLHGHWYLVGYCHVRSGLRTFRVDRLRGFRSDGGTFVRPEAFDAFQAVATSLTRAQRPLICKIRLFTTVERVSHLRATPEMLVEPDPQGVLLTARAHEDHLEDLALDLLNLSCGLVVLEPPALKKAFADLGKRAAGAAGVAA